MKKSCHEMAQKEEAGIEWSQRNPALWRREKRDGDIACVYIITNYYHIINYYNYPGIVTCSPAPVPCSSAIADHKVQSDHSRDAIKPNSKIPSRPVTAQNIITRRVDIADNSTSNTECQRYAVVECGVDER
jgi:hypothetical protein